jgi:hypothetical protein
MDGDALLLHQVHPAKLATDVGAELVSGVLLWRRRLAWGLATHVLPPLLASAAALRWADLEALRRRRSGRYILAHMPPVAQGVRLAGDAMMAYGAWRRRPAVMAAGVAVVGLGWSHGLLPTANRGTFMRPRRPVPSRPPPASRRGPGT